jgi:Gas vesicle protein G
MDPLTLLFRLPLLPMRAFIRLGEMIQDEVEHEMHDPALVRRKLEEAEEARAHGEASDDDVAAVEAEAVGRLVGSSSQRTAGPDRNRS